MFKRMIGAIMAAVMTASVCVTSFAASDIYEYYDSDGYLAVDEDGNGAYYDYRRNSITYFDEDGSFADVDRRGNVTYYDADDDDLYYYDNSSSRSSSRGSSHRSYDRIYTTNYYVSPRGWTTVGNNKMYIRDNGSYATNCWEQINGKWYSFDNNGVMRTNQWVRHTSNQNLWYYVGSDGAMLKNTTVNGYFINANGECWC